MKIAESLKRFRKTFNLKQKDVAETLGVKQQSYQVYEAGTKPSVEVIVKLSKAYGVSADYLLGLSDAPINPTVTDADNGLIEALIACHKALHDVLEKRGLKKNDCDLQDNEQAQRQAVRRADASTN